MIDEKTLKARSFVSEVQELAQKYGLSFFIVTEGASAISNNGCDVIDHARKAHIEWEIKHGIDPDHDWSDDITS